VRPVRKKRGAKLRADEQEPDTRRERWTSKPPMAKSISIKDAERKSGGCAGKAVELTSGDLLWLSRNRDWESRETIRAPGRSQQRA